MINLKIIYDKKNEKFEEMITAEKGVSLIDIKTKFDNIFEYPVILAKIDNENFELNKCIYEDCEIKFLDIKDEHCYIAYKKSVALLMLNSIRKILGENIKVRIKYSINQNWYCDIKETLITEELISKIKESMLNTASQNLKIEKINFPLKEAFKLFEKYKMHDRARGLKYIKKNSINLYKLENTYDYFYSEMALDTKDLNKFDIIKNEDNSFTLCFPDRNMPESFSEYKNIKKLNDIFEESINWAKIAGIDYVHALNSAICNEKIKEIILITEALQEKKIANIADSITKNNKKFILISGPSSSGKTTFANRLCVQLKVNGVIPHIISLDDYYHEPKNIPRDENGDPDFECLEALDIQKINLDMENLLNGKIAQIPKFNFTKGKREKGKDIKLNEHEIVIIEGIHGLNQEIGKSIPKDTKFKIFISALTQLNIDSHNRIPTSDTRIFRRIVRDHHFRGFGVKTTLNMWNNVLKGEVENIFPFQEEADIIFNSSLIYELAVLKPFVEPLLFNISNDEKEYAEARRLLKFLDSFLSITKLDTIPPNSIIREFIGGGCF